MALLSDTDRQEAAREYARRYFVALSKTANFDHDQLKAAVDTTDAWIDSNQNQYNNALPVSFRNGATLTEKTLLFSYVAMKRAGIL